MDTENVVKKLLEILPEYGDPGGLTPDTKPLADQKGFESDYIPEVVRRVARALDQPLPKGKRVTNVFVDRGKKLSVREIARKIVEKYAPKGCKA
jgi:hypothetical protein